MALRPLGVTSPELPVLNQARIHEKHVAQLRADHYPLALLDEVVRKGCSVPQKSHIGLQLVEEPRIVATAGEQVKVARDVVGAVEVSPPVDGNLH